MKGKGFGLSLLHLGKEMQPYSIRSQKWGEQDSWALRVGGKGFLQDASRMYYRARKKEVIGGNSRKERPTIDYPMSLLGALFVLERLHNKRYGWVG